MTSKTTPPGGFAGPSGTYSAIQQPAAMSDAGNVALNWREWKSSFDCYIIAAGKENASSREKCALFLHVIGKAGREVFEELDFDDKAKIEYDELVQRFTKHCDPARNVNFERHLFFEMNQGEECFEKFLSTLKLQSKTCEFGTLRNSLILTQIIRGIKDSHMRERLLAKSKLELDEAVSWCRAAESAGRQAEACGSRGAAGGASAPGLAVEQLGRGPRAVRTRGRRGRGGRQLPPPHHYQSGVRVCDKCGRTHSESGMCAARNAVCYRCNRLGHFANYCRIKSLQEVSGNECEEDAELCESLLYSISIDTLNTECEPWFEYINVNKIAIKFKLDSGADASVMSLNAFKEAGFNQKFLKKNNIVLREISKSKLSVVGYFEPELEYNKIKLLQKVYVLDLDCNNLLGLNACINLGLIKRINEVNTYKIDCSIFDGLGCLPSLCKIDIDKSMTPVVCASRKIPIKMRPKLKEELDNMIKLGVIQREDAPTDWVSNIVIVERPDKKIRVCLDPYHLNLAVRRCHFQLPTLDEIASSMSGAVCFSKLDAKKGFWMLKLDENSSKLCTFATPFGRYRFMRMPFGIKSAPEIFHNEMYKIFSMPGVEVYCDDILVWGNSKTQHDERLEEVMRRAQKQGVKFNKEKCKFGVPEINYLGHIFNRDGMRPDEKRVSAIINITKPADRKDLERFLGLTNYLSRFIPNYAQVVEPLRILLKKDNTFIWCHTQNRAFEELKRCISSAPVLRYYSPREPVTLSVDASGRGLGACLLQSGRPVAYAARTLTPNETRWAQIEKELLAIVFGCMRFHQFVYGHSQVTVESDHKPLEIIFKKALNETPARLQRLLLKLQAYSLNIVYKPGKMMHIADALSRAATEQGTSDDVCKDVTVHVNAVYESLDASPECLERIKLETVKDEVLTAVIDCYQKGWASNKINITEAVRPFWSMRQELHVINGILFRNEKIVIPTSLRNDMLLRIHEGHLGIEKCKRRARAVMWWPSMGAQVEQAVRRCGVCQRHRAAQPRQPLSPHAAPQRPWQVLAADLFEFKGSHYLLVVDYYSKFVEVAYLANIQSGSVIKLLKNIFARFGIPTKLVTDNGTQFSSAEFKVFSESWEFHHVTSSPLYPRSNGLAERNVQTIKKLFTKASEDGKDWQLAILNFRNTPISGELYSPAQLLMGRSLNTRLPAAGHTLDPRPVDPAELQASRVHRVARMKDNYDRATRGLPPLHSGTKVRVRDGKVWVGAQIVRRDENEQSYWVKSDNGGIYRRNREHILLIPDSTNDQVSQRVHRRYHVGDEHQGETSSPPESQSPTSKSHHSAQPTTAGSVVTRSGRIVRPPKQF